MYIEIAKDAYFPGPTAKCSINLIKKVWIDLNHCLPRSRGGAVNQGVPCKSTILIAWNNNMHKTFTFEIFNYTYPLDRLFHWLAFCERRNIYLRLPSLGVLHTHLSDHVSVKIPSYFCYHLWYPKCDPFCA